MPGFNILNNGDAGGPSNTIDTARAHRYELTIFEALRPNDVSKYIKSCTRPSCEIEEIKIHNGQDLIFRPGKNLWNTVDLTFYEIIPKTTNATAELIYRFWAESTINIASSTISDVSKYNDIEMSMFNSENDIAWAYHLYRCWPTKISPNNLDYSDSAISETTVTIRYDKAKEFFPT